MMDTSKVIKGVVSGRNFTTTAPIIKENYGIYLQIEGVELPETYQVDFSNEEHHGTSVTMIGNADGVRIPRQFIDTGKDIFAFLYWVGEDYGKTVYKFRIPNKLRPDRTSEQPTPEEQSVIDQAISALNEAVAQTAQDVIDADASAQASAESARASANSAVQASLSESNAERAKGNAQASAESASASATASAQSASDAEMARQATTSLVAEAQRYANASEQSATESANSAEQAESAKGVAQSYAQDAQTSATYASVSESTANAKAQEASSYAQTASAKATESAQSASQALTYKNDAESAKTASQTAQGLAESARDSAISAKNDAESARDEAQNIVDGISAKAEQIDANTASVASLEEDRYKPYVVDSASGAIASFSDGAGNLPLKSLVVGIDPVQDLHGQDAPYPAGGGKNKITATEYGGNLYSESAGKDLKNLVDVQDYTENGNVIVVNVEIAWRGRLFATSVLPAGDYHIHFETAEVGTRATIYVTDGDLIVERYVTNKLGAGTTSMSVTLTDSQRIAVIFANYQVGTVTVTNLQVESGSAYTSWSPYENLCPISGWTELDVEQSGVNVWDEEWEVGTLNNTTGLPYPDPDNIRSKNFCSCKPNTDYYFYSGSGKTLRYYWYDADYNLIDNNTVQNAVRTSPSNARYFKVRTTQSYGSTYNHDISINYPSTDHSYHPYTGRSITIDLGQTVYGGTLNVLSGVMRIDRAGVDLGTLTWVYDTTTHPTWAFFRTIISERKAGWNNFINSIYPLTASQYDRTGDKVITGASYYSGKNIIVRDTSYADATAFKTAVTGQQLVYKLATPIEIQLTPQQVNSLLGVNNIFADTGDSEVEYRADTKLYINKKIAEAISALS